MDEPTTARQARARWSQPPVRGLAGWSSYGKGLLCTSPTAAAAASGAASSSRSGTSSAGGGPQYSSSLPRCVRARVVV